MARMADYGMQFFRNGIVFHCDRRKRWKSMGDELLAVVGPKHSGCRGVIQAFSTGSQRRLEFTLANAVQEFRTFITLTYHAVVESWETDIERNRRVVRASKGDLNRFLTVIRKELGAYLWVQEFQQRGVVHYHLVCEREVPELAVKFIWLRAIGSLDDPDARRVGVKVETVRSAKSMPRYLGYYVGKGRQKCLPRGVDGAGRWWGASRSLKLALVAEVGSWLKQWRRKNDAETRTVRCMRKFVSRVRGFRYRGGFIIDWKGELSARCVRAVEQLRQFFGVSEDPAARMGRLLDKWGWEEVREECVGKRWRVDW